MVQKVSKIGSKDSLQNTEEEPEEHNAILHIRKTGYISEELGWKEARRAKILVSPPCLVTILTRPWSGQSQT